MAELANPENEPPIDKIPIGDTTSIPRSTTKMHLASFLNSRVLILVEVAVVVVWALFFTQQYQNLDPNVVPSGREFLSAIQTHHFWNWLQTCGSCAFWNGSERGGAPTLVDPYSSMLHPLVAMTTLGWGVRNGAKIALVAIFIAGGLTQWWLSWTLGLGRIARVWSGMMAVVAGHLGSRMENGNFGIVLSTIACAMALPPIISLARGTGGRRMAAVLGIIGAMAIVAGQGYLQIALVCSVPLFLFLLPQERRLRNAILRRFALAGLITVLLAGIFLVPFLHFLPEFNKYLDPKFSAVTPFQNMFLYLIISDPQFYYSADLQKQPYPYLYSNFIGWISVGLIFWAFHAHRPNQRRILIILLLMALLVMYIASGVPLAWIGTHIPPLNEQMAGIRFHPLMSALAIPPLLGLAAIGLDRLIELREFRIHLALSHNDQTPRGMIIDPRILLTLPLLYGLVTAWQYNSQWMKIMNMPSEVAQVIDALHTDDLQWVNPPFGEHEFIEPAVAAGLKLSSGYRTWHWRDHPEPQPVLNADRKGVADGEVNLRKIGDINLNAALPGSEYAAITASDGSQTVCSAHGLGGMIDVQCDSPNGGLLNVLEYQWSGWQAAIDGQSAPFQQNQVLAVQVPPGKHTIALRYQPWDVPLGIALSVIGAAVALFCLLRPERARAAPAKAL